MAGRADDLDYVNLISPEKRQAVDEIRAEIMHIVDRMMADDDLDFSGLEALAWNVSEFAHRLITLARREMAMDDWRS